MKSISIDSNSILDMSTKKPMSEIIDFSKEYVTTETDKDTVYKAGDGINISSDNTISIDQGDSAGVESADATTAGIMKLYGETGANSDGTMTQESITDELDNKAPIDSPEFTGTPTAPTPDSSDEGSDRLATTAYVLSLLKNNPGIIDELLTAINGKLDKTTADSTYLTKTTADSTYLATKDILNKVIKEYEVIRSGNNDLERNFVIFSKGILWLQNVNKNTQMTLQGDGSISIEATSDKPVYINGSALYFNGQKLA